MITERDLQEAIAECEGVKNPNANTCMMLASFYTILDHIKGANIEPVRGEYSFTDRSEDAIDEIDYISDTDFAKSIYGRKPGEVWPVMDELMTALQALNPKLYNSVMRRL